MEVMVKEAERESLVRKCMRNSTWKEKLTSACQETKLARSCGYADVDAGVQDGSYGKDQEHHASGGGTSIHLKVGSRDVD